MGFGQNYSVTKNSDMDMVIVIKPSKLDLLLSTWFFEKEIPEEVINLFKRKSINLFWVTKAIEQVEVNTFIYDVDGYTNFLLLRGNLRGFLKEKLNQIQISYGFDGREMTIHRKVTPFQNGFLYKKPALLNGKYWGGVPRQDFLYSGFIVLQEKTFFSDLEKRVWKTTIKQLIKEYGRNIDLNKVNILNTHHTYQTDPQKMPLKVIKQIQKRTKLELEKYLSKSPINT